MSKIGLFFGPEKGSVHRVAEKIKTAIGTDLVDLVSVNDASAADLEKYDKVIFGISTVGKETWDSEYSNTDWAKFFPEVSKVDYTEKVLAIYGLGDHITYPGHFVNAMGRLYKEIKKTTPEAKVVAPVDPSAYEFEESEAVIDGQFVGLPVDEDFEPEMTDERVVAWAAEVKSAFGL
ncbi:flavodoxin domain-containing protein [Mangrovibacterium marinum]|uniref:Flavodoxin n=1 Tax=Mangrovibacterium marinum TaxID=1639118 RepID=A0A2T5C5K7_9BACT|nr:flavodoxin domain-containing protein [Mangrovibacterium marinum]PTN10153.1 flavodoxin I [Mangrovibacterium marinum]